MRQIKPKRRSLKQVLYIEFIIVILLPIIIIDVYYYQVMLNNLYSSFEKDISNVVNSIDGNIDVYFDQLENQINMVSASKDVENYLEDYKDENILLFQKTSEYINQSFGGRLDIASICLYDSNNNLVFYRNSPTMHQNGALDDKILETLNAGSFGCKYFGDRKINNNGNDSDNVFTLGCKIVNLNNGNSIGSIIINLNHNTLDKLTSWDNIKGSITLIYNKKTVISKKNENEAPNKSKYFDYSFYSDETKFTYSVNADKDEVISNIRTNTIYIILASCLCFFAFFMLAYKWIQKICDSLNSLEIYMQDSQDNGYDAIASIDGGTYKEIDDLVRRFNVMQVEVQTLMQKQKTVLQRQAESEYKALQFQIQPHFLYNSLDSINCLAAIHGDDDISEMIQCLSQIFKYSAQSKTLLVPLSDEIQHVRNYCTLQAIRYQNRFRVIYRIDNRYNSVKVIRFMLQPIVENAIKYGMQDCKCDGEIIIGISEMLDYYEIFVCDNGNAMSQEKADEINKECEIDKDELDVHVDNHIGLYNVQHRLKYAFGNKAKIFVSLNKETRISVIIPKGKYYE